MHAGRNAGSTVRRQQRAELARGPLPFGVLTSSGQALFCCRRQTQQKTGPFRWQIVGGERAAVILGNSPRQRKPKSHPCFLAAHKGLEDLGKNMRSNSRPC